MDESELTDLLHRFVGDLGATTAAAHVVIGHRLGLYEALAGDPATAQELADRTGCDARYVGEWLRGQAAGGYVDYDPDDGLFTLSEVQAFCLADPNGPVYLPGAFLLALGALRAEPRVTEAFRTGAGIGWHEQDPDVFLGCEAFFRPGYLANLVPNWIPALTGAEERLRAGGRIADLGCGLGAASIIMAEAFPRSTVSASDYHEASVDLARDRVAAAGVGDRVSLEVSGADSFSGSGYDLVTTFDCLHDMGDPLGAARHVREAMSPEGSWLVVEPIAADRLEDNLNPVGRMYYGFSGLLCVPNALSQPGGYALGTQAGEAAIRQLVTDAGFTRFRRAAETAFNAIYEARP